MYVEWKTELNKGLAHAEVLIDFGNDEALDRDVKDHTDNETKVDRGLSV